MECERREKRGNSLPSFSSGCSIVKCVAKMKLPNNQICFVIIKKPEEMCALSLYVRHDTEKKF